MCFLHDEVGPICGMPVAFLHHAVAKVALFMQYPMLIYIAVMHRCFSKFGTIEIIDCLILEKIDEMKVIKGDITKLDVDAIVNAANSTLLGGGGVDGAIHRAGGPQILDECIALRNRLGMCPTGNAVVTSGGKLPAKYVIHTVGPVWHGGTRNEPELLADCYRNSLALALEKGCESIAFPCISTGVYGYPKREAAAIAVGEAQKFLVRNGSPFEVQFVCFDDESLEIYSNLLANIDSSCI